MIKIEYNNKYILPHNIYNIVYIYNLYNHKGQRDTYMTLRFYSNNNNNNNKTLWLYSKRLICNLMTQLRYLKIKPSKLWSISEVYVQNRKP